jgi:cyclohexadienyl dehydratase
MLRLSAKAQIKPSSTESEADPFRFASGLLACLLPATLVGPANAETPTRLEAIAGAGALRVGLTEDYRPFSFADASGEVKGIDVDMAMGLAQSLGVRLEIVKTSWPTLKSDLEANRFDIAMGGITITLDRQKTGLFSHPVFSSGKTPITHCGDESKYGTIAAIDQPGVHVIVNPGGTNERFDRAHLQKATIVPWSDNATIFDALVEGKADLMITDAVETRVQAKLHPGVLCPIHPNAPFDHSELAYWMPRDPIFAAYVNQWAEPSRPFGRASGDPRSMDAVSGFPQRRAAGRSSSRSMDRPIF